MKYLTPEQEKELINMENERRKLMSKGKGVELYIEFESLNDYKKFLKDIDNHIWYSAIDLYNKNYNENIKIIIGEDKKNDS